MWYNYKLSLFGDNMNFISKLNIHIIFWSWIDVLLVIAKNDTMEDIIKKIVMVVLLYCIIMLFAKTTKHKTSVDSYIYLRNLLMNKSQIVEYYVSDGNDINDKNNWIFKI